MDDDIPVFLSFASSIRSNRLTGIELPEFDSGFLEGLDFITILPVLCPGDMPSVNTLAVEIVHARDPIRCRAG
jgi:hypothetical protein